jgi:hypothetical protein
MYTFDEQIVSDLHKDARGFRPSQSWWEMWNESHPSRKQEIWDALCEELSEAMDSERRAQAAALTEFEAQIKAMKKLGAETTRQAIKWVFHSEKMDRYDLQYGADYVAYHFGMAYNNPYRTVIQECCDQALAVIEQEKAA